MSSSEVESRNITIQMRKSVENLVLSSQDAIGQSISQALNFSGVISQHTSQLIQDSKNVSRAPSPSPRNFESATETLDNDKTSDSSLNLPSLTGGDNISVSSNEAVTVISSPSLKTDNSKTSTPNPRGPDATRTKKKSWYNSLYPTYKNKLDDFKRLFKDLPDDERLIVDYSCALQKDILAQGRLYASQNYLCFYAYILGWETSLTLRWKDVTAITKEKTALVIPNAILVCTDKDKHFLTSISSRDKAYLMLFRIWQNALMDQPLTSHKIWQWVHSCYGEELGFNSDEEYMREGADDAAAPSDLADKELLDSSSMDASGGGDGRGDNKSSRSASRGRDSSPPLVTNGDAEERDEGDALPTDMSDTSESEPDKPNNGAEMEQCTDPHDGKLILSGKFPFNIDTLFTMIFTNSKFQLELLAERGTSDYVESPWQVQNGRKFRQTSYKLSLSTGPIGPKEVQVTETQVMNKCSKPGVVYSIECQSENSGIPYADHVTVIVHYCLRRAADCATHLALYATLRYRRSMWPLVKAVMEKSTMAGLDEFSRLLEARLNAEAENAAPATRKARRHRRATGSYAVSVPPALSVPPRAPSPPRAPPAPRWPLVALLLLLLLNALLYWRLYHTDTTQTIGVHHFQDRAEGAAERQAAAQRHQLRAWARALHRAAHSLAQTEQALMKVLETIKPTLEKVRQESQDKTEL
ncbi:protein Aster-B-like [Bombyx mandarina]|uniref:Protein Aster-B-like n=1 Tax=Bombyx mandarina TaxID=7092 RepID=A0A6J2KNA4_BOMMA|nr:protein Aster-B-like [Bombyx mandarina]